MEKEQGILGADKDSELYHSTVSEYKEVGYEGDDVLPLGERREDRRQPRRTGSCQERDGVVEGKNE